MRAAGPAQLSADWMPRWMWLKAGDEEYAVRQGPMDSLQVVPRHPRIALDSKGRPRIGLLVVLSRAPMAGEESIAPLIVQGQLTMVVTLDVATADLEDLERQTGKPCRPAFLRHVDFALATDRETVAEGAGAGCAAPVALNATLSADLTLEILGAFDGYPCGLSLAVQAEELDPLGLNPAAVDDLLRRCGGITDRDQAIRLLVLSPLGNTAEAPRLIKDASAVRTRAPRGPIAAVAEGDRITALPLVLSPGTSASAAALVNSGAVGASGRLSVHQTWYLGTDLAVSVGGTSSAEPMPLVEDPAAAVWPDVGEAGVRWYVPRFELVRPAPNADPALAEFSFLLRHTAPSLDGSGALSRGLAGKLRLTLRLVAPDEAAQAPNRASWRQVPLGGLVVALELPYRRAGEAQPLRQRFPGIVVVEGTSVRVTVDLLDEWVRVAYAALAYPPAAGAAAPALVATFAFAAAVPLTDNDLDVVVGGKRLEVAVLQQPPSRPDPHPSYIVSQQALVTPHATMLLAQELPRRGRPAAAAMLVNHAASTIAARPPIALERPPVIQPHPHIPPQRRGRRTIGREDRVDALLPCADLGGLYLEDSDGQVTAIGCRDALKLGEASGKAFSEVPALRDPAFTVYRSLQQPGRFLLVPRYWRVGRHGPTVPDRAYRPMMLLYARLGDDPATDRYNLAATLIADVGAAKLARLQSTLRALTPANSLPDIVLPTDPFVAAQINFQWAVPAGMASPETLVVVDTFMVNMTMDGPTALLVTTAIGHDGLSGRVSFALGDGTTLTGALQLSGEVIGPADGGPVTIRTDAGKAALVNRTSQPMNVFGVVCIDAQGAAQEVSIDTTLAGAATEPLAMALPPGVALADARPASVVPLETLDLFVENISQLVVFVNQLNFANHGITELTVHARIAGAGPAQRQVLAEGKTISMTFSLPVTAYLERRKLEFALAMNGAEPPPGWKQRELSASAVIGITPDLL